MVAVPAISTRAGAGQWKETFLRSRTMKTSRWPSFGLVVRALKVSQPTASRSPCHASTTSRSKVPWPNIQLYCFAQSGNAYRAALMLNLIGADWEPVWVDFFGAMVQRTPEFRTDVNEMGEAPVLVHGKKKLTQSGVILTYLARRTGKFKPEGRGRRTRSAALDHFRQPKGERLPRSIPLSEELRQAARRSGGAGIPEGPHRRQSRHRQQAADRTPISRQRQANDRRRFNDRLFLLSAEEFGFDIAKDHPAIGAWLDRMKALPGWKHPYDLMPGLSAGKELSSVQPRRPICRRLRRSGGLRCECRAAGCARGSAAAASLR